MQCHPTVQQQIKNATKVFAAAVVIMGAAVISWPAQAAKKYQTWVGTLTFTSLTQPCKAVNQTIWFVGTKWHSIYRPKLASTHPNSSLSVIGIRGAMTHVNANANSKFHGAGTWQGNGVNKYALVASSGAAATGSYNMIVDPQNVTGATDRVQIRGTITNFFNIAGCTIKFNAVYHRNIGTD